MALNSTRNVELEEDTWNNFAIGEAANERFETAMALATALRFAMEEMVHKKGFN